MAYNLLKGKKGLIFGALNEQSIAWKVAERAVEEGAEIVLTNTAVSIRMGTISKLAEKCNTIVVPARATRRFTPGTIENGRLKADSLEGVPAAGRYPDDCTAIKDSITVSALKIDLTDEPGLGELQRLLA